MPDFSQEDKILTQKVKILAKKVKILAKKYLIFLKNLKIEKLRPRAGGALPKYDPSPAQYLNIDLLGLAGLDKLIKL